MLTNNFKTALKNAFGGPGTTYTDTTGRVVTSQYPANPGELATLTTTFRTDDHEGFVVGSGSTPASKDDYFLSEQIKTSALKCTISVVAGVDESARPYSIVSFAMSNSGSESLKIAEIGLIADVSLAYYERAHVLVDRTVLDSPVILGPGESCGIKLRYTNQFDIQ